jgi:hypothetical protein
MQRVTANSVEPQRLHSRCPKLLQIFNNQLHMRDPHMTKAPQLSTCWTPIHYSSIPNYTELINRSPYPVAASTRATSRSNDAVNQTVSIPTNLVVVSLSPYARDRHYIPTQRRQTWPPGNPPFQTRPSSPHSPSRELTTRSWPIYPKSRAATCRYLHKRKRMFFLTQLCNRVQNLDLQLQHHRNRFTTHHGATYLHFDLPKVLSIIGTFLLSPKAGRNL